MRISDLITEFILNSMTEAEGALELQRSTLAERFGCVPSQINYVLETRFSPEHGYIVETKRGGGGYIRITKVRLSPEARVMHAVNSIGARIDAKSAVAYLHNLSGVIPREICAVIGAACGDNALRAVPPEYRDEIRAGILKMCLIEVLR